ncbi:hypothetical protein BVY01_00195 [bacterium I07]|nr:hypothetical protein BVY01_00195 [bacterium I07]
METRHVGGRPQLNQVKLVLRRLMKEIQIADVSLAKKRFIETTGQAANYHTIKKYLDELVADDFLRVQVVRDNIQNVEEGKSQIRRRVFLYQIN